MFLKTPVVCNPSGVHARHCNQSEQSSNRFSVYGAGGGAAERGTRSAVSRTLPRERGL